MEITVVGASGLITRDGTRTVIVDPDARYFDAALSTASLVRLDAN